MALADLDSMEHGLVRPMVVTEMFDAHYVSTREIPGVTRAMKIFLGRVSKSKESLIGNHMLTDREAEFGDLWTNVI